VLTNTGGLKGQGAAEPLATVLLRHLLGLPDEAIRMDILARPEVLGELCGWYDMDPGPPANLFGRLVFGAGVEVIVRRGKLWFGLLSVIPTVRHGFPCTRTTRTIPMSSGSPRRHGIGHVPGGVQPPIGQGRTRHRFEAGSSGRCSGGRTRSTPRCG
jgi:hypothetical protein